MTGEERKARAVSQKLVDALAEFEAFQGDSDIILQDALFLTPKKEISERQLIGLRAVVRAIKDFYDG